MLLAELSRNELRRRTRNEGLCLQLGPYIYRCLGDDRNFLDGLEKLYRGHTVVPSSAFADFRLVIERTWVPWSFGQIQARVDGVAWMALPADYGFAVFEWAANRALHAVESDFLVLHAATLANDEHGLIALGISGAGKSTFAAATMQFGWRLLSDEMALIDPKTLSIQPISRPVILKGQSLKVIRHFWPSVQFGPITQPTKLIDEVGHLAPTEASLAGRHQTALPRWIVQLRWNPDSHLKIEPLSPVIAIAEILRSSFNPRRFGEEGFEIAQRLVNRSHCLKITYRDLSEIPELLQRLEAMGPPSTSLEGVA